MVCFFGPDSNGALPDPPCHLDPVRVLRQEPPLALFSGFGCPPTTSKAGKTPLCGHCGRPGLELRQVSPAQLEARCSF